ncbi:Cytochrome P450 4V2, partial [Stegodyphus mimosarum]
MPNNGYTHFTQMELRGMLLICMLLLGIIIVLLLLAIHIWFSKSKTSKSYASIPAYGTAKPLLLLWQYFQQLKRKPIPLLAYFMQLVCAQAYMFQSEGIFKLWLGWTPYVVIFKAEHIKKILNSRLADKKSDDYLVLHPLVRTGLATSNGEKNRSRRKLLQPTFHSRILEEYISIFNEHSLILVSKLKKMTNEPSIDISDVIVTWALDDICHTAMGIRINAQEGSQEAMDYLKAVEEYKNLFFQLNV